MKNNKKYILGAGVFGLVAVFAIAFLGIHLNLSNHTSRPFHGGVSFAGGGDTFGQVEFWRELKKNKKKYLAFNAEKIFVRVVSLEDPEHLLPASTNISSLTEGLYKETARRIQDSEYPRIVVSVFEPSESQLDKNSVLVEVRIKVTPEVFFMQPTAIRSGQSLLMRETEIKVKQWEGHGGTVDGLARDSMRDVAGEIRSKVSVVRKYFLSIGGYGVLLKPPFAPK